MSSLLRRLLLLLVISLPAVVAAAPSRPQAPGDRVHVTVGGENTVLVSTGTRVSLLLRESAGPDTFDLYGGPRNLVRDPDGVPGSGDEYVEGKFQDPTGTIPRGLGPSPENWTGVDRTEVDTYWNVSTFNAENLNDNGAGNRAMWAGLPASDPRTAGWTDAPGYGNNWNDVLEYVSSPLADPSVGQTVDLDFVFNLDTEPAYDFFRVQYDSAGTWIQVYERDGTNKDALSGVFPVPGLQYAAQPEAAPIVYAGNDYGTDDRIRIRLIFASDGAYSDEDGLFVGDGAVQLDDVTITSSQGAFTEDFESGGPYLFELRQAPFAGDFSMVFARATDLDACAENRTPQVGFIDFGQAPPNGPGTTGTVSTGGSLSSIWDYGIPGGFVVNYTGGLDGVPLVNQVWSPEIDWDLPGTADDGADVAGAILRFDVWRHNPLSNGIFYNWQIRSFANGVWDNWTDFSFVYFSATPEYFPTVFNVAPLLEPDREKVQLSLGLIDLAESFGFPGIDATPAPWYDNVRLSKVRIGGPAMWTRTIDSANDGFPVSGAIDTSTPAARDLLDVRFDMARDVSSGDLNVPGDSVIVDVEALLPGTEVADVRMKWALRQNPLFEAAIRQPPGRSLDENFQSSVDASGRTIWTGEVVADSARTAASGVIQQGRFFVDLPDEDFLYPGDVLHYFLQATDSDGRVSTLPNDTSGFGQWDARGRSDYSRAWTVRALPSIEDAFGSQPTILVYNDFGRRGGEAEFLSAFGQLGLDEGVHYDTYTTQGPSSGVSNGIGSAGVTNSLGDRRGHGATADQLAGYSTIVYLSGNLNTLLISDGSNVGQNDKSPDLQTLTAWKNLAGQRNTVYFGDFVASALVNDSPVDGATYVATVMGASVVSTDVRTSIGGQTAPTVRPTGAVPGFDTSWIAFGGCFGINQFDDLRGSGTAVAGHGFVDPATDQVYADIAASVVFDRIVGIDRKVDVTFPFGLLYVYDDVARAPAAASTRTRLLEEVLSYFGTSLPPVGDATAAPSARTAELAVAPNPFNPKTTVRFALPRAGMDARVVVLDVRGRVVRTQHDGPAAAADLELLWNGHDDAGARVASGVYLIRAVTEGFRDTRKAVLVK